MSKLQQLLETLCPDGVEYKMLADVCTYKKGTSITKQQIVHGNIPVIAGGTTPAYYHNEYNREGETIAISSSGTAGYVSYWNEPVFLSDSFSVHPCELLTTKYTYYYLKHIQQQIYALKKGSGIAHVYAKDVAKFMIPTPPPSRSRGNSTHIRYIYRDYSRVTG